MTVDEAIICLSDMKIKVAIPKAAVQARLNNDALNMAIEALKCSEIPNNWIPCSERLPDEKGEYLVTYHPCYWDDVEDEIKVGIDSFRGKTAWAKKKYQRVIAWMPLPEPYQGGEQK